MVVIRVHGRGDDSRRRSDFEPIRARRDVCAQLRKFRGHCCDSIGLLDAPAADVFEARRLRCKERRDGERHRRVRDRGAIDRAAAKLRARPRFDEVAAEAHIGALLRKHIGKADVALNRVA